jgi:hypothetical protein
VSGNGRPGQPVADLCQHLAESRCVNHVGLPDAMDMYARWPAPAPGRWLTSRSSRRR